MPAISVGGINYSAVSVSFILRQFLNVGGSFDHQ
jgi:hypothetical protein